MKSSNEKKRPVGVLILIILFMLGALNNIGRSISSFSRIADEGFSITTIFFFIFLIFAVSNILLAYGFIKGIRWSWYLAIIMCIILIFLFSAIIIFSSLQELRIMDDFEIFFLISKVLYIGILLCIAIIFVYLTRPKVLQYFGKEYSGFFSSARKMNIVAVIVVCFIIAVSAFSFAWPFRPYMGDISISDFHHVPSDPLQGEDVTFYITIHNLPSTYVVYLMEKEYCDGMDIMFGYTRMINISSDKIFEASSYIPSNRSHWGEEPCEENFIKFWVNIYDKKEIGETPSFMEHRRPTLSSHEISFSLS